MLVYPRQSYSRLLLCALSPHTSLRSLDDFQERIRSGLATCGDNIDCPSFIFRAHIIYVRELHAAYGEGLHIIPTERLYAETADVLDEVVRVLNIYSHDFQAVTNLSVNVNGNPGIEAALGKTTGDYPPLTPEILAETQAAVLAVARFVQETTGFDIGKFWQTD